LRMVLGIREGGLKPFSLETVSNLSIRGKTAIASKWISAIEGGNTSRKRTIDGKGEHGEFGDMGNKH